MEKTEYVERLKDPRWQKKRLEIFERDSWQCQWCYEDEKEKYPNATLHIHHIKYFPGDPWDCPDNYLDTVCERHHNSLKNGEQRYVPGELEKDREYRVNTKCGLYNCSADSSGCLAYFGIIKLENRDVFVRCQQRDCNW